MKKIRTSDTTTWDKMRQAWRKDPDYRAAYEALEEEFQLANALIAARTSQKLTQAQLAAKAGMHQTAIARLESGTSNPSYRVLVRVADALDKRVAFI